jgi:large conductance mechanosensitive channel
MKGFFNEFKEFLTKGNLLAIAVGFVMGVTFAALISSFVDNIIMPIVAIPFGEPNFDSVMVIDINDAQIRVGAFITTLVTFIAVALVLFVVLKAYNKATGGEAGVAPPPDVALLTEIRDILKSGQQGS